MSAEKQRLGNLVNIKTGKLDANASSPNGVYPFFTCSRDPLKIDKFSYDCECVLVAGNGDLNVKYYQGKFDAYQRTYIIESKDKKKLDVRYLYYFLDTYLETLRIQSIGGVIKYIKLENLSDAQIPLPPLPIQKRIAEILDAADALRKKDQELLKKYDELAQAIFIDMFGDPVKNEKGWEIDVANNHMDVLSGYAFKSEQYSKDKNNISLCGGLIIMPWGIEWDKANRWSIESSKGLEKFFLKEDDIVMAMDRPWISTGFKIAMIKKEDVPSLLVQRTARIRAKDINQFFLYFLFKHSSFEKHVSLTETTVPHISPNDIRSFEIIVPPIKLQNQYAENIKGIEAQKQVIKMQINFSGALFNSCIQKAFSGELVS